ncbi:MAG: hypothetical protein ACRC6M_07885 [Microcystaceae cyanobacterium]
MAIAVSVKLLKAIAVLQIIQERSHLRLGHIDSAIILSKLFRKSQ